MQNTQPTYINLEYIFNKILEFLQAIFGNIFSSGDNVTNNTSSSIGPFKILLFVISLIALFVISYTFIRLLEIRKKEKEHLKEEIEEYAHHQKEKAKAQGDNGHFKNERWENVLGYLTSSNPSDWKLAILEADSMLEELTDQLEMLQGENLGERLKSADKEKFKSLDDAWEAHLARNKIAHDGSQFELSQHEANRLITLYENVFREFGYI